jgi:hypothetical protein
VISLDLRRGFGFFLQSLLDGLLCALGPKPFGVSIVAARPSYPRQKHLLVEGWLALLTGSPQLGNFVRPFAYSRLFKIVLGGADDVERDANDLATFNRLVNAALTLGEREALNFSKARNLISARRIGLFHL